MKVEIIRDISEKFRGTAKLVKKGEEYFAVSHIEYTILDDGGPETLVFPCDKEGNVTDWCEVAGGKGVSIEEAIKELENLE